MDTAALTVGQFLDRWLEAARSTMAVRTFEEPERIVRNQLKPRLGAVKLAKLNALHIEGMTAEMQRQKEAAWTVRHSASVLHTALVHAVKLKLIASNPAAAVDRPGVPTKEMLFLDEDQSKRLMPATASRHQP